MKKLVILFSIFTSGFTNSYSQAVVADRCGQQEYLQSLAVIYPGLQQRVQQVDAEAASWLAQNPNADRVVITIPVVVHVVWNTNAPAQNIPDDQIYSQIDALNRDFRKLNSDWTQTPSQYSGIVADVELEFCLAQRDEQGNPTNGITRTESSVGTFTVASNDVKDSDDGGIDNWDPDQYLNIWVCNLQSGVLGYASLPGFPSSTDGVVIHYKAFGTEGSLFSDYDNGRTCVHEIGHWLGLYHIWGDDGNACTGSDYISDTPVQADENYGCPSFPEDSSCGNGGDMFFNYMDYVDDDCMYMFTNGQKSKMTSIMNSTRYSLKYSIGCNPVGVDEIKSDEPVQVFPNPASENIQIRMPAQFKNGSISICNVLGQTIYFDDELTSESTLQLSTVGWNEGTYFILMKDERILYSGKFVVIR